MRTKDAAPPQAHQAEPAALTSNGPGRIPDSVALRLGAAAAGGAVGSLAFAPLRLWPLLPLALAGLFVLESGVHFRTAAAVGAAWFTTFSLIHNWWVSLFGGPALVGLTVGMALFGALHGSLGALLARGWGPGTAPVGWAVAWVVCEWLRTKIPFGGFPWGLSAHALPDSPFAGLAPLGGPLLMGAGVAAAAAGLAAAVQAGVAGWRWVPGIAAVVAAVTVAAGVGLLPDGTSPAGTARVALVQATTMNRDPTPPEIADRTILSAHLDETAALPSDLDLVTWGESSIDSDPRRDPELGGALADAARRLRAPLLVNGSVTAPVDPLHLYNTTFIFDASGRLQDTYEKRHLAPFGEYVPLRRLLQPWVKEIEQVPRDHLPGERPGTRQVGDLRVALLICFESADTGLARAEVRDGAELFVVNTNNRSFSTSPLSDQHVDVGRVLAQSTGRTVLHTAVSGQSAVILPGGEIVALAPLFVRASLVADVPLRSGQTPFARLGDWAILLAVAAGTGLAVAGWWRRRA